MLCYRLLISTIGELVGINYARPSCGTCNIILSDISLELN